MNLLLCELISIDSELVALQHIAIVSSRAAQLQAFGAGGRDDRYWVRICGQKF
jgi:hypothetical protein